MAWNDDLQDGSPAHHIASSTHERIRVLAGPGTGKSFAMKRRVARILEEEAINPWRVLAITFTRVAAEDLHRELVNSGTRGADQLRGQTLHSLAMAILMRNHVLRVLGRVPRPLNEFEMEPLLADLGTAHGNKKKRKEMIRRYGSGWARLLAEQPGYARSDAEQAFEDDLINWLIFHKAMLMDEVVPHLYQYLNQNPGARELTEYEHILVDEYQDLNRAEQEVVRLLGTNGAICVIGDDDQSIYGFRNADPEGIRQWHTLHDNTDDHQITECMRCPTIVVRMANALIARNPGRYIGRAMNERPANGQGEVVVRQYVTAEEEAQAVSDKILRLMAEGVNPSEIIVLAQRNTFASPIFRRLSESGVPVKSYYAESELDTLEAQERFSLLKLFLDNEDRVALRWLLGVGSGTWLSNSYKRLMDAVRENNLTPWATLERIVAGTLNVPHTGMLAQRFVEIKGQLAELEHASDDIAEFKTTWLPPNESTQILSQLVDGCDEEITTVEELYEDIYDRITRPEVPLEVAEVRIMSLHKSKGLSSPYVFIVGCIEGLMPAQPDADLSEVEQALKLQEDRRLFYVGVTRVKARPQEGRVGYLALTYPQSMPTRDALGSGISPVSTYAGIARLQPSRFLAEMGPHIPAARFNEPL